MPENQQWFYVRNWWKYQHYSDRNPPWIKLHRSIETDPAFQSLPHLEQYYLIRLWLVASDMDGRLPIDSRYIQARLGLYHARSSANLLAKLETIGLISKTDIRGHQRQSASPSRVEAEKRREEKNNPPTPLTRGNVSVPSNGNSKTPKTDQACEEHAQFIRSIGNHASPDQKLWLQRFESQQVTH